jgi:hypothetical protein
MIYRFEGRTTPTGRRVLQTKVMLMGVEKRMPRKNLDNLFGKVLVEDSRCRLKMVKENPGVGAGELLVHSRSQMEETDRRIYSFTASFDGRRSTKEEQHGPPSFAAALARPNQGLFAEGRQVKSVALSAN